MSPSAKDTSPADAADAPDRAATTFTDRPPYEQARDELIEIVARLESGEPDLEESLRLWERGEHLAAVCQEWLDGAQARLDAARDGEGEPSA